MGLKIENQEIVEIIPEGNCYEVKTQSSGFKTRTVIIASGASSKKLGVRGEEEFIGRGVSYCGTCDGPLFKNKDIVVIGAGDRAIEDAIFLAGYAKSIYLVHRRNEFRAAKILVDKLKSNPKVKFVLDSVIEEINGDKKVSAVKVKNVKTLEESTINCAGVFIFVGINPDTRFVKNLLEKDAFGFIITDRTMSASKRGIFACGDCVSKSLYQVVSACGEAALAADSAHKYLLNL